MTDEVLGICPNCSKRTLAWVRIHVNVKNGSQLGPENEYEIYECGSCKYTENIREEVMSPV